MSSSTLSANSFGGSAFEHHLLESTIRVSGSVLSYADQNSAGNSSVIRVEPSTGIVSITQKEIFGPGATFVSVSISTSDQETSTAAIVLSNLETPITLILGTSGKNLLESTPEREIFWGGNEADIFRLSSTGALTLEQADMILDYSREQGDYLAFSNGLTVEQLNFQEVDLSGDGIVDATAVRSRVDNTILGVVRNTINTFGNTRLSAADIATSDSIAGIENPGNVGRVRFIGDRLTPYNLSLIQNGDRLEITVEAIDYTKVALKDLILENPDNLIQTTGPQATGEHVVLRKISRNGQTVVQDSFDVLMLEWQPESGLTLDPLKIEPGSSVNSSSTWIKLASHDTVLRRRGAIAIAPTTDGLIPTDYLSPLYP